MQGAAASCEQTNTNAPRLVRTTSCVTFYFYFALFLIFSPLLASGHTMRSSIPKRIKLDLNNQLFNEV